MTKTALVTGGSRGIGKACAIEFAKAGCNVAITYAGNEAKALETVKELEAIGVKAKAYKFDVASKEETAKAIEQIHADFETIDILVNNAGITRDNLIIRMSDDEWEQVINTNLTGVFNVTKPVCKIMMKQRQGAIVNMTSIAGVMGNAGQTNYSSAKAGLIGFTKSLAKELASRISVFKRVTSLSIVLIALTNSFERNSKFLTVVIIEVRRSLASARFLSNSFTSSAILPNKSSVSLCSESLLSIFWLS